MSIELKSPSEIEKMRIAGKAAAEILEGLRAFIKPGISTKDIDVEVYKKTRSFNMKPAFLGYGGFPASACVSVNDELVHGIPNDSRVLSSGDIVTVDIGTIYEGYYSDTAYTFPVGKINNSAKKLLQVTEDSLYVAIEQVKPGNRLGDVSYAVQNYAEGFGFSIVREYCGHGVGRNLHEEPNVPNFGKPGTGVRLVEGMTFAIEPMVNFGKRHVDVLSNQWTVVTRDGSLCAHFEHTVVVTKDGCEILTKIS
ncbi:type I methionyl aminopeptidase [Candidatus Ruminimicrobium bovinum]|uniref:type I methionyl aminopeptidase n=1 Tax=Candidatus Ruminimicrobium bovinum TaxID=3242779 RepID=UPI0039B98645